MSKIYNDEEVLEQELMQEAEKEADIFEQQEDIIEEQAEEIESGTSEISKLKESLARTQADYENFKKRTERDKSDMMMFLRADIFSKVLPRIDDLERMITGTPEDMRNGPLYEGLIVLYNALIKDLEKMGVKAFVSQGQILNPDMHEVMTQVPGNEGIVIDEFQKGYMIGEKVLRVAKVVVGSGN